jgi:transposase
VPRYPSDLTDEQWELLEPQGRAAMAELRKGPGGAPMSHDLRAMLDTIGYVTRYGIEWRALPVDFPPWTAVYAFFERWSERGLPQRLADRLRERIRVACGRGPVPTAAVIDSQTVRAADTAQAASCGYDAGKKTKGRKRNIATDCLGLLLVVTVTAASVQDRDAAHRLLALVRERFSTISLAWADGGYAGRLVVWAKDVLRLTVAIVKRSDNATGFVVLPRILWNLICQVHPCLPWLTATIGSSVAVAGTPISRGVAPTGVGTSTSLSRSLSRASWPSSTAARSSSVRGTLASIR